MRTLCLAVALGFVLSLLPAQLPAQSASEEAVERWGADLKAQEERLRRQEWKAAAKTARDMVQQMADSLLIGQSSATVLALALVQQAVAEAGLGHQEEAVWLLHLAQNLDARYREVALGSYGPAGAKLELLRLRQLGRAAAAWPELPAEGSFQPPRVLRQEAPRTPDALARALVTADVEVEVVVGPDGRVAEPVLLTEPEFPSLAFVVLDSLRGWRFEPARASGEAVPALFRTRISHPGLQKAAKDSSSSPRSPGYFRVAEMRLEKLDARLRQGEAPAIHAETQALVSELRASGAGHRLLAAGLRTLALAEAGIGRDEEAVWHWQIAQNLQPGLVLDSAAYGNPGALLARHKLRRLDQAPADMEAVAVAALGAGVTPPRKIAGDELVAPGEVESGRAPQWIRLQAVIDNQGRIVEPVVLAGRSTALRWAALEAVRTWRFEPARRDGQPVAVLLDIELPPRAETPLAEMMPFTGEHGSVHALVVQQDWEKARTRAATLVQRVAEGILPDPRQTAAALVLLALADAGSGGSSSTCYWHAAQSLYGDLYHADLDAYGTAGALLEASNPWLLNEKIFDDGTPPGDGAFTKPEKIPGGPVPQYTTRDRLARVQGSIILEAVLEEDGRISQPWILKGLTPGIDLLALTAICEWRFKPATLNGKPIRMYYTLTTSYDVFFG